MTHQNEIATAVLAALKAGIVPWRYPHYREAAFEPLCLRFGSGHLNFEFDYTGAEALVKASGARIVHHWRCRTPRCHRPPNERIVLPLRKHFENDAHYFGTVFHELLHFVEQPGRASWTGAADQGELIAEVGTSLLEAHLGLPHDDDDTNIKKWLSCWSAGIEDDPEYLFAAVRQAEKSVKYLLNRLSCATEYPAAASFRQLR